MKEIELTRGMVAIVDDDSFESLNMHKWFAHKSTKDNTFYAQRQMYLGDKKQKTIGMHGEVLPGVKLIDHINNNGLDNRRENLRAATVSQNAANNRKRLGTSSKFKGVYWNSYHQKWKAHVGVNGKRHFLGYFDSEIEAAKAYNVAAIKYFGEYAKLNDVSIEGVR